MFKSAIVAALIAITVSAAPATAAEDDVVTVVCIENTSPRWIAVYVGDIQVLTVPYAVYPEIAAELGLPPIICD